MVPWGHFFLFLLILVLGSFWQKGRFTLSQLSPPILLKNNNENRRTSTHTNTRNQTWISLTGNKHLRPIVGLEPPLPAEFSSSTWRCRWGQAHRTESEQGVRYQTGGTGERVADWCWGPPNSRRYSHAFWMRAVKVSWLFYFILL